MRASLVVAILVSLTACASTPTVSETEMRKEYDVSEMEMRKEYDKIVSLIVSEREYEIQHFRVDDAETAAATLARLRRGELFDVVARDVSAIPGANVAKDYLSIGNSKKFPNEFVDAVKQLAPSGISPEPLRTRFGWHVIKLVGVGEPPYPSFDDVKEQIRKRLLDVKQRQ